MRLSVLVWFLVLGVTLGVCNVTEYYANDETERLMTLEMMEKTTPPLVSRRLYIEQKSVHKILMIEIFYKELDNNSSSTFFEYILKQHDDYLYHGFMGAYQVIKRKELSDYVLVDLAIHINKAKLRGTVLSLLNLFPPSLKALISSSEVCIQNRKYAEYFYAAADDLKYDVMRRNVYTWVPLTGTDKAGNWNFIHLQGNEFRIINSKLKEPLFAEIDSFNYNSQRRRIFTTDRTDSVKGDVWAIEFEGNDVFIRNVLFNEYIYSLDQANSDNLRRQVLAWIPKGRDKCDSGITHECRWTLIFC